MATTENEQIEQTTLGHFLVELDLITFDKDETKVFLKLNGEDLHDGGIPVSREVGEMLVKRLETQNLAIEFRLVL